MPDTAARIQPHSHGASAAQTTWQRWSAPVALVVAVVALGLAIWALTSSPTTASEAAPQAGDPKMRVCTAFDTVSNAVRLQTHTDLGADPVPQAAVAGNARLAMVGGGEYMLSRLDSATAPELADAVRSFADDLQDIGMHALAGIPNTDPVQADRLRQADSARKHIVDLCK